jgi:hypothetical protein
LLEVDTQTDQTLISNAADVVLERVLIALGQVKT